MECPGADQVRLEYLALLAKAPQLDHTIVGNDQVAMYLQMLGFETWRHRPVTATVIKNMRLKYSNFPMICGRKNSTKPWTTAHMLLSWVLTRDRDHCPFVIREPRKATW